MSETADNIEILAFLGRKQIELENSRIAFAEINNEYDRLLKLLSLVISGEIDFETVTVDQIARSWAHTVTPAPSNVVGEVPCKQEDQAA